MHFWTKEGFVEKALANQKANGLPVTDRISEIFKWAGELVELAYNEGFEAGKETNESVRAI